MTNEQPPSRLHDKWLAVAIWAMLLIVLIYSSANGMALAFGGSVGSYLQFMSSRPDFGGDLRLIVLAFSETVITLAFLSQLIKAWLKFADLSHDLIIAYAKASNPEGENIVFMGWLVFESPDNDEADKEENTSFSPEDSTSSSISEVLRPLAYAWAINLISPSLIAVVNSIFRQ